jgi:hypothetical protein
VRITAAIPLALLLAAHSSANLFLYLERNDTRRRLNNLEKLAQCDRDFAAGASAAIRRLEQRGYRPWVRESWRSPQEQEKAYRRGVSEVNFGFHNVLGPRGEPRAFAADIAESEHAAKTSSDYALAAARAAQRYGLSTGILWGLGPEERAVVSQALYAAGAEPSHIGWDPCHFEPVGLSLRDAIALASSR